MPTDGQATSARGMHPAAARRILRLALGTSLCLAFSQVVNWPLSFVAPVLTMFILALPLPPPGLRKGIVFVLALLAPTVLGAYVLLPFLTHMRGVGILLVGLGLFFTFYYTARGGQPILGTFMTMGLTLVTTIGSVSSELLMLLVQSLGVCAAVGIVFVWIAHALLPDPPPDPSLSGMQKPAAPPPDPSTAGWRALRSLAIVFPVALAFLFMSGSPSYTVVMIKVATMGQQATADHSRAMGRSLLESTFWGGIGAIIAWQVLAIWPSLLMYVLLVGLAALIYGRWIFQGPAVHPNFQMVSFAYLTMLVILGPAVLDGAGSSGAGGAFWTRLGLFVLIAVYGTVSVWVFDSLWPERKAMPGTVETAQSP
ncbi:MAG: DUF2955 domain-containing protein [Xanthomonadales bacterium]